MDDRFMQAEAKVTDAGSIISTIIRGIGVR
jgi:hypothetical protein